MQLAILWPPQMSEDEAFVSVVSTALWILCWLVWYWGLRVGSKLQTRRGPRRALAAAPIASLALVFLVLRLWSSHDVRDSPGYLYQYLALGGAWVGIAMTQLRWLGISARDDVAERGNPAAAAALFGALLGTALCYAGGNVGDGPGWWVVLFSSGLATAAYFVLWTVLETAAHPSDSVTIDRDLAAGLRHAAFCIALGLVLGCAAAGDWESAGSTLGDFAAGGWPALLLLVAAILLERSLAPAKHAPRRSPLVHGVLPGAAYVTVAIAWLALHGVRS